MKISLAKQVSVVDEKMNETKRLVPVNDGSFMKEFESTNNFGCIKSGSIFRHTTELLNMKHEITATKVFHHETKVTLFLDWKN